MARKTEMPEDSSPATGSSWFEDGNYMMGAKRMTVPATKPRRKGAK